MADPPKPPPEELDKPDVLRLLDAGQRAAARVTQDVHLQQDAASEALERLLLALTSDHPPVSQVWLEWVRTTARNFAKDEAKKAELRVPFGRFGTLAPIRAVRRPGGLSGGGREVVERAVRRRRAVPSLADDAVAHQAWKKLLTHLDALDQRLLLGKYVSGYSTKDLAQAEGLSAKAVEHRLARARESLRERLGPLDDPFGESE